MKNGCVTIENKDGVAILRLDDPKSKVNAINKAVTEDLVEAIESAEADSSVSSMVLISGKPGCFIAGADITMFGDASTVEDFTAISTNGQQMMNKIGTGKPKVAAIGGSCLGGGLELAMACHYRIASEDSKTSLGLPEVMLGLLPGAGGTQRLPKLIGMQEALPMMLTGKQVKAKKAKSLKLVDGVADPYALEHAAILAAQGLAAKTLKVDRSVSGIKKLMRTVLEEKEIGRNYLFKKAKETVMKQTGGKYPAPLAILEAAKAGLEKGFEGGSAVEAKGFGTLGVTPESKALISIFFGQTAAKKNPYGKPENPVQTIGILGAGLMGAGIAQVSIEKKFDAILKDLNHKSLSRGEQQIYGNIQKKRSLSNMDKNITFSRLTGVVEGQENLSRHLSKCDLVVEAVFEDMGLKHKVIKQLEPTIRPDCIIATNTSSLEVAGIAAAAERPERVIGMHYFSPVDKMPLLEIIPHATTSKDTCARAVDVGLRQGKTVIVTKDVPGFYVNRCLGPYMVETMALLADGVEPQDLDKALKGFGMPVGPIALSDEVGADVAFHVQEYLSKFLGDRMKGGSAVALKEMLDKNFLGRKTGAGFYTYAKGEKGGKNLNPEIPAILAKLRGGKPALQLSPEDIALRMMTRFANEAVFCLQDEIITDATAGDIGAVFGVGFPPFLGGPFRWIDAMGPAKFADQMRRFQDSYGEQFAPAPLLADHAKANKKFHTK